MNLTAIRDNKVAHRSILGRVTQAIVDLAKVVLLLAFCLAVLFVVWNESRWDRAIIEVHPFNSTDTEIGLYAIGCDVEARFTVKETSDEIRVSGEKWTGVVEAGCLFPTYESIELDDPIGARAVIDAETGEPANLGCWIMECLD